MKKGEVLKIGIFGKSGSGKTTVANFFEKKGFYHIDLDEIGRNVLKKYPKVLDEITAAFGDEFVKDGVLRRRALADHVFEKKERVDRLNGIFFKYIRSEFIEEIKNRTDVVAEGAVLVELGIEKYFDRIIRVCTKDETALKRLLKRDEVSEKTILDRLAFQAKYDSVPSDFTIETNDSPLSLKRKINKLFRELNIFDRRDIK
jgi:dephospho-CoA kinase